MLSQIKVNDIEVTSVDSSIQVYSDNLIISGAVADNIYRIDDELTTTIHQYNGTDADLDVCDSSGYVLCRFENGEIETKNFNSALTVNYTDDDSKANLNIGDEEGYVICQFSDGHIKTKNFDSRNITVNKAARPLNGIENFTVKVNYQNTYCEIGISENELIDSSVYEYDDYCVVGIPENYSSSGTPVRLIIHCGGTGERIFSSTNPITSHFHGWEYFLAKGYAVLDCNGISDSYISTIRNGGSRNHFGCKYLLQSYKKAYDYVIDKYNIASDGCFVAGISMGGLSSFMIVQSGLFPVLAQAGFCPCIDLFKQNFLNPWSDNTSKTAIDYGFDFKQEGETNAQWFIRNIDKTIGWNSMMKNVVGDASDVNDYFDGAAEEAAYEKLNKPYPCPLKIWHCKNDSTVTYRYSKYIVTMIRNAGCYAELHSFDTGGHGGGWLTGSVQDGSLTTSINFYEAIKFFERFSK